LKKTITNINCIIAKNKIIACRKSVTETLDNRCKNKEHTSFYTEPLDNQDILN